MLVNCSVIISRHHEKHGWNNRTKRKKANDKSYCELSSDSTLYFSYLVKIQWRISCKWQRKSGNLSSASCKSSPQTDQLKQSLWKTIQSHKLHHLRKDFIAGELKNLRRPLQRKRARRLLDTSGFHVTANETFTAAGRLGLSLEPQIVIWQPTSKKCI